MKDEVSCEAARGVLETATSPDNIAEDDRQELRRALDAAKVAP